MLKNLKEYHYQSSYDRDKMHGHLLDGENRPRQFKEYPGLNRIGMPRPVGLPDTDFSDLLKYPEKKRPLEKATILDLSGILHLSYGITARAQHGEDYFYFRTVASAGGLYPSEIYVSSYRVKGLADGLYYFSAADHSLTPLRAGNISGTINALSGIGKDTSPFFIFFFSAIFFRSAWKYRERAYRYNLLDTGHLVEQTVMSLKALGAPFFLTYDFDDSLINSLLGVNQDLEVCLAVCLVPGPKGSTAHRKTEDIPDLPESIRNSSKSASFEKDYPIIREAHKKGFSADRHAVTDRGPKESIIRATSWQTIRRDKQWTDRPGFTESTLRRRSRRNFIRVALKSEQLHSVLASLCDPSPGESDSLNRKTKPLITGALIEKAEGFDPGFYIIDGASGRIGLVKAGRFIQGMAHVCLGQLWINRASVHILFLADLELMDKTWGGRAYRYAMMEAGRTGQKLYLAAESAGLGCCGIGAFYDKEASAILDIKDPLRLLYLVVIGTPADTVTS